MIPTTLSVRATATASTVRIRPVPWRIVIGLVLVKLSRWAFAIAERLCRVDERVARR